MKGILLITALFSFLICYSQNETTFKEADHIGPRNKDMSQASSIFIMRKKDEFTKHYFGLCMDETYGLLAKVRSEEVYEVRTLKTGPTKLFFKLDSIISHMIDIRPNTKYYLELTVGYSHTGTPILNIVQSDSTSIYQYSQQINKSILVNYSHIRYDYSEHISSFRLNDSIQWYCDDAHHFSTLKPKNLDAYTDYLSASVYFFAPPASLTYSEGINVHSIGKEKFGNLDEFKDFVSNSLQGKMDGIKSLSKDEMKTWEALNYQFVPNFTYSSLVYYEVEDHNAGNLNGNEFLLSRVAMVVFTIDSGSKNEVFVLSLSERGLIQELSTKDEILKKITPLMNSLELHNGVKKLTVSRK